MFTTVRKSATTRIAFLAIEIRLNRTLIPRFNIDYVCPDLQNLDSELVSRNTRIREEGHFPQIATDIGTADTNTMNPHEGFA